MNISLCMLVKNEQSCIKNSILSCSDLVNEVIVVDDHSTDRTVEICKSLGAKVFTLPWTVPEKGFAASYNYSFDQSKMEWILWIDADEELREKTLHQLTRYPDKNVWALPRRKWLDSSIREEYEAYPDWQIRFFRNTPKNRFTGEMHPRFIGDAAYYAYRGPHIEHYQNFYRTTDKQAHRDELYKQLAERQNVSVVGGFTLEK